MSKIFLKGLIILFYIMYQHKINKYSSIKLKMFLLILQFTFIPFTIHLDRINLDI